MLNAAVIGLGWWGQTVVEMLANSSKIRPIRVMTRSREGAAFARAHDLAVSANFTEVLKDPKVEAVILCTPHSTHYQQILDAAAEGRHVFCEKPLTLTRREAEAAITACNTRGVTLGVGHERRFDLAILELRRRVAAGELGTLLQVEANFNQDKLVALSADNWRLSAQEAPAGPLTATGIHMLDLAISFLGPVERVMVNVRQLGSPLTNGDTLGALAIFKSGANALIGAVLATPFDGRFALYGNSAWADVRDLSHPDAPTGTLLTLCHKGNRRECLDFKAVSAVRANLEAFADAALGRSPYPVPQDEMIWTIAALEALFKSAGSGRVETVEH